MQASTLTTERLHVKVHAQPVTCYADYVISMVFLSLEHHFTLPVCGVCYGTCRCEQPCLQERSVSLLAKVAVCLCRPETPDASSDYPCNIVSSSGHSTTSVLSAQSSEGGTAKAPSPPNLSQALHKPSTNPNPFQAAAMKPARSSDLSSDGDSEVSYPLTQPARALSNSPARAHALQPLEEEGASAVTPSIAQLTMMERTHSAPGGIPFGMLVDVPGIPRPRRRLPVSIPEDRPVAPMGLADDHEAEAVHRPIRKVNMCCEQGKVLRLVSCFAILPQLQHLVGLRTMHSRL